MKVVAGLGNPGERYRGTRHNVGFEVIDLLARRHGLVFESSPVEAMQARWRGDTDTVVLAKPLTFMNLSGHAVVELCRYYRVELPDVLIVCDDVNLPVGRLRARANGSEGGHNGLRSIAAQLGTSEYGRLRVGVGRGDLKRDLSNHVLAKFDVEEQIAMERAIVRSADAVETWVSHGIDRMMSTCNRAVEATE
ncbi:MAG: aminoacyl-tRNA hydrolase [Vicinamibacterales bacterium]